MKLKLPELRDYQKNCIETLYNNFKTKDKQLIQLPTGAGKTFIFLNYLKEYSRKALIVCPSVELMEQIYHWAKIFLKDRKVVVRDRAKNQNPDVLIVTAQSLVFESTSDYVCSLDFDHVIIDETHHAQAKTYKNFLRKLSLKNKFFKLLGCTATPERLDGKSLLEIFNELTFDRNVIDLIKQGHLCNVEATRIKTGVKPYKGWRSAAGDFSSTSLKSLDNESRNAIILKTYEENCTDKKTIVFCLNVDHTISLSNTLKAKGFRSAYIYGDMNATERAKVLKEFKYGKIQVLTNCQLLTEGFDEPSIEAIIIARPTFSKSLYCQMVGRGLRNFPGKEFCHLYELTDNCHKICTFMVIAGFDNLRVEDVDYKRKTNIIDFHKELISLDIEDIEIEQKKFSIFEETITDEDGKFSLLKHRYYNIPQTESQKKILGSKYNEYNFLESAFVIWKNKLKEKYGNNRRKSGEIQSTIKKKRD